MIEKNGNENEDDIDGCDINFNEEDATADEDLPPAEGGVEDGNENEDDIDGCDIDFSEEDATADEDLPPAEGGVES